MLGGDPWADAVRLHRRFAYVPGDVTLWPNLTGGEAIDLLCRLGALDPRRKQVMLERFDLDPTKKARAYSKGNRQKVALVAALASDAELLLLDEPTSGLDPLMEAVVHRVDPRGEGRGPLGAAVQPHLLRGREARRPGTIIRDGVTVETGTIAELRHLTQVQVTVVLGGGADGLAAMPGVHDLQQSTATSPSRSTTASCHAVLARSRASCPSSLVANPPSLEELFLRHYGTSSPRSTVEPDDRHRRTDRPPAAARRRPQTARGHARRHRNDGPAVLRRNRVRLVCGSSSSRLFAYVGSYYGTSRHPGGARRLRGAEQHPVDPALTGLAAAPNTLGGAVWTKIWMFVRRHARVRASRSS